MNRGPASFSANKQQEEVLGDSFSTQAQQATSSTSKRLSMLKSSSFHIHPNLRSMCLRSGSRSLSRTISDTSSLSFIEEPLCAYLSLFDGTRKDLTGDELHIIDNLFSDEFVHIMDGVIDDNEEVVIGNHGIEGRNFVGVGVNHDKLAVETGQNNRSSIYLHLRHNPERRWFRVRGGKSRKNKGKQYEH